MNFNSIEFLVFLPIVWLAVTLSSKTITARNVILLLASYAFYMTWDWRFASLILASTIVDYFVGILLGGTKGKHVRLSLLLLSLTTNLGLLFTFKYFGFFAESAARLANTLGFTLSSVDIQLLLPVGISFYTFQTLGYTIDVYRNKLSPERSLLRFAVFVAFFPQLVAGPIVRAADFLPQLRTRRNCGSRRFRAGLFQIICGLLKKVVIADVIGAVVVDPVFDSPTEFSVIVRYVALVGYACQIYNDFSGYSDIAIGSARLLGFDLPANFRSPYVAVDIRDFWGRWHISLSTWLRDYLYIPLGGNRKGTKRTYVNLLITMLLGGLWHGAAWNFILWGAYHGLLLAISHARREMTSPTNQFARQFTTFHFVLFGWLLFRVSNMQTFFDYFSISVTVEKTLAMESVILVVLAVAIHFVPRRWVGQGELYWLRMPTIFHGAAIAAVLLLLTGATIDSPNFIYFQF